MLSPPLPSLIAARDEPLWGFLLDRNQENRGERAISFHTPISHSLLYVYIFFPITLLLRQREPSQGKKGVFYICAPPFFVADVYFIPPHRGFSATQKTEREERRGMREKKGGWPVSSVRHPSFCYCVERAWKGRGVGPCPGSAPLLSSYFLKQNPDLGLLRERVEKERGPPTPLSFRLSVARREKREEWREGRSAVALCPSPFFYFSCFVLASREWPS